ncbi:hypothetical protein V475_08370 [Sphingobium baderi LL03]|uniref:Uncharacterized protein n=2 Tax=Sphingobium TaxID=165695 RepID=T0GDC7_9SPHN|nr:hypothetical protein L485_10100 [Sphingobium baderi LL03]KMS62341.1 hypothetical protein V475_08370 [Sphingobium baderi LL03]TWH92747.1 hypothetical protein IQ35_02406 [Sphingobium wenxiniae]
MTSMDHVFSTRNLVQNKAIGKRSDDPLPRLLLQLLERAGPDTIVGRASSRPWASALFQGRRHVIILALRGADAAVRAARFAQGIEEAQWSLHRHFVADIAVDDQRPIDGGTEIELSVLTIEDW